MKCIPKEEGVVIGANFNGCVGEGHRGNEEVMGGFSVNESNLEGQMVLDFAKIMEMVVGNSYHQNRKRTQGDIHCKSEGRSVLVDNILCR